MVPVKLLDDGECEICDSAGGGGCDCDCDPEVVTEPDAACGCVDCEPSIAWWLYLLVLDAVFLCGINQRMR